MQPGLSAEELYYSESAAARILENESAERRRLLGLVGFQHLPGVATAEEFLAHPASEQMIMSPMFGAWLDQISLAKELPGGEEHLMEIMRRLHYIQNYVAAAAFASGQEAEVSVLRRGGGAMIPEVGRVVIAGRDDNFVRVRTGDGLTFATSEAEVHIPPDELTEPSAEWQPLRFVGPPDFRVALNDIDPNRTIFRYPLADRLSDAAHTQLDTVFCDAWDLIQQHDPLTASIVRASLNTLVPAPTEPFTHGKSMASGAAFGVIGVNEYRDPERFASHLVFGIRKHLAIALRGEQPSMYHPEDNPAATKFVYPPSREGHGIAPYLLDDSFINIGLARFFANLSATARPELQEYAQLSFSRWFAESRQNLGALRDSNYITDTNRWILTALEQEIAAVADRYTEMPGHLKQAVATNALDRMISWRLHNLTPDPQAIQHLRGVWLRGEQCPPLRVPEEPSPSIEAYTHTGQRTRYVLKEVSLKEPAFYSALQQGQGDQARFGTPTAGDIAHANGNIREARNYFRAAVHRQTQNPEAWAGFGLTFEHERSPAARALLNKPELAAALYAAVGNHDLAPEEIAAWVQACRTA